LHNIRWSDHVLLATLLPHLAGLRLLDSTIGDDGITLTLGARRRTAACPRCGRRARRRQSHYTRRVADLPIAGRRVALSLRVWRFFCRNRRCTRAIFAERFTDLVPAYGRRTVAQRKHLQELGCTAGGSVGARLARLLGLPASRDTVLRLVRAMPAPEAKTPRVLGVDDWATRRGCSYGTILVDEEARRPIALLADRTADTFAAWLAAHPGVEVITRDRAAAYADGATRGAPAAVQVADRFHLVKNLGEALLQVVMVQRSQLAEVVLPAAATDTGSLTVTIVASPRADPARRARRLVCYEQVVALRALGWTHAAIADKIQISQRTILRWLAAGSFPERKPRRRPPSAFAAYADYLTQRWAEGCHNATQLWREVCAQGYGGPKAGIWTLAQRLRCGEEAIPPGTSALAASTAEPALTPGRVVVLMLQHAEDRSVDDQRLLSAVQQACTAVKQAATLCERLLTAIRDRLPEALSAWLSDASGCGLTALERFAHGLQRDLAAVRAACSLPYSNGQAEGQITRLKLIKRSMYGRAKLDLLERRVLYRAAS
jgi:transposase